MPATATLNLRVSPRRMLSEKEAAEYCARPLSRFRSGCPVRPVAFPDGTRAYDMRDLDSWLDQLKGEFGDPSVDEIVAKLGR